MDSTFKTMFGMTVLILIFLFVGRMVGGTQGMVIAFVFGGFTNFLMYFFSDKVVLAMHGAQELSPEQAPTIHRIVDDLAAKAGIPKPKLYGIPSDSPNAFATGRSPSHAAVAVTHGLMRLIDERELRGVLAHELGHVINRDMLLSTLVATFVGAIGLVSRMALWFGPRRDDEEDGSAGLAGLLMLILLPIMAVLVQLFISRQREFAADRKGAELCEDPRSLASALERLEATARAMPMDVAPASAHLFIVNPLAAGGLQGLLGTHPSTAERVSRLRELADTMGRPF